MKIAIMGSGGIGGYYGCLLARAGHAVTFIARAAHLASIQTNGLQVKSVHGDFLVKPANATDNPIDIGPVDLVLFCVKTPSTEQAVQVIRPIIAPHTVVMSLQNGIDAAERIGAIIGMQHMLGAATWISSAIESPGVVRHFSKFRRIAFGELDGQTTQRAEAVLEALQSSGATVELSMDIHKVLWTKFVFIAAASAVGSLTRLEIGEYRAVPETRNLLTDIMREVEALARSQNIALEADVVEKSLAFIDTSAPSIKPSMQRDIETGHVSELEAIIGIIGRKGHELNVLTPVADFVYAALLPIEQKAQRTKSA
jgi:2-dehydropantoate 2-reductase